MNKLLIIILVLVVVFIVGPIIGAVGYFEFYEHTTKLNNYTGNGVSFKYPADYNLTEVKNNSTALNFSFFNATKLKISPAFLIAKNTKNPNQIFLISKSPVNGTVYHGMNLDEYGNSLINDFKSRGWITFSDNTTLSVDNSDEEVQAYSISYATLSSQTDSNSVDGHLEMFDKNGIRYIIDFEGKEKQKYDAGGRIQVDTSFTVL
ncbi:MAG: hypothetical protein ABFC34_04670 [Methanobacterium sp.]